MVSSFPLQNRISGQMTLALTVYSATFMRYSLAVTPKNRLLFLCHLINETAQLTQGYRYLSWNYWGGKERSLGMIGAEEKEKRVAEPKVGDVVVVGKK